MYRINNHIYSIPLPTGFYTSYQTPGDIRHIHSLKLTQAVDAIPTIIRTILTEIPQNIIPQAFIGKAIKRHLPQPVTIPFLHNSPGHRVKLLIVLIVVNKKLIRYYILAAIEENTFSRFTVPGTTAGWLLLIRFISFPGVLRSTPPRRRHWQGRTRGVRYL